MMLKGPYIYWKSDFFFTEKVDFPAQAPVVQRVDNAIRPIIDYPVDKCWKN